MGTLVHFLVILGLVVGLVVARLAKSELKAGAPYFKLLRQLLIAVIAGLAFSSTKLGWLVAVLVFLLLWLNELVLNSVFVSGFLGFAAPFFAIDVPVFLYFLVTGTVHEKKYWKLGSIGLAYVIGLAIALLLLRAISSEVR